MESLGKKLKKAGVGAENPNRFSPPTPRSVHNDTRASITFLAVAALIISGVIWLGYEDAKNEKLRATQVCLELRQKIDSLNLDPKERELLCSAKALKKCAETCMEALTGTEQQPETKE